MENKEKRSCLCGVSEYVVFACSGASDLGQITDIVARKLRDNGVRNMNCLLLVGAGFKKTIENLKKANILMLDGCSIGCGKKILDKAGFANFKYLQITELGFKKGQTPVTEIAIKKVYDAAEIIY